tara:strand:+ start:226 stop:534 length:309 start_codon:yes stop_codon:yes gene_type:complete
MPENEERQAIARDGRYLRAERFCYALAVIAAVLAGFAFSTGRSGQIPEVLAELGRLGLFIWLPLAFTGIVMRTLSFSRKAGWGIWFLGALLWAWGFGAFFIT